jgi:5-methylcytosine-specific restriction endonuclease McrA
MESEKQILEELQFVYNLSNSEMSIKKQELFFIEVTKKSRATFYRDRKAIGVKSQTRNFSYSLQNKKKCYFCNKKSQVIHHINGDRKENNSKNLIPLCRSCHNKIHRVLANCRKVARVSNVENDIFSKKKNNTIERGWD